MPLTRLLCMSRKKTEKEASRAECMALFVLCDLYVVPYRLNVPLFSSASRQSNNVHRFILMLCPEVQCHDSTSLETFLVCR